MNNTTETPAGATDMTLRGFMIKDEQGEVRRTLGTYQNGTLHLWNGQDTGLKIGENPGGVLVAPMV